MMYFCVRGVRCVWLVLNELYVCGACVFVIMCEVRVVRGVW